MTPGSRRTRMLRSHVIGFPEPLASVPHTFRTLMRSRQKVTSALSVLMRLFAFPRYNITTGWMTAGADGNRRSPCEAS